MKELLKGHKYLDFIKMESQGNSYIYFDVNELPDIELDELAKRVANKNFGIGSDGMVLILPDEEADAMMRIFNADGSEAELCGSALKSVIAYLTIKNDSLNKSIKVRTAVGIATGELLPNKEPYFVKADVEKIVINDKNHSSLYNRNKLTEIESWKGVPIDVGNPHFVVFDKEQELLDAPFSLRLIEEIGPKIEKSSFFPDGINVELVKIVSRHKVEATVWERGSGETAACGSGALAIVIAGQRLGYLDNEVEIAFPGGSKFVEIDAQRDRYFLSGNVNIVCIGSFIT